MGDMLVTAGAALVAFAVDRVLGELPPHWHPVVWMGEGAWSDRCSLVAGAGFVFRTALILLTFRCGDGAPPPVRIA